MSELKTIFCKTLEDLPTIDFLSKELENLDRVRLDYNIKSEFKKSDKIINYITEVRENLNVDIYKSEFKDIEFYNIYKLLSQEELSKIYLNVEEATKSYQLLCEELINKFKNKYNYDFRGFNKSLKPFREKFELDNNKLTDDWKFYFHGGDICFKNLNSGQIVDVNLKYEKYGVLDLWFFQCFLRTTTEFRELSKVFEKNTPKLVQTLKYLREINKLDLVNSNFKNYGFEDKFIWKNRV